MYRRLWKAYVVCVREAVDSQATRERTRLPARVVDRRMIVVIGTAMMCLLLINFFGHASRAQWLYTLLDWCGLDGLSDKLEYALNSSENRGFNRRVYWTVARLVGYTLIPLVVILFVLRESVIEYGVGVRGAGQHWRLYAAMFALLLPIVVLVSFDASFQAKYPFYRLRPGESLWPYFVVWELLYAAQFVALEFFFRGFMVHGLKQRFGFASIWVMVVPYMMIHFGKPFPEAVGSIFAGIILGALSLKSNSVWWGACLHIATALSMDLLALWHRGVL